MSEYPAITSYFKKIGEAQSKLSQAETNIKILESLVDQVKVSQIQDSVQKRMGPFMCDNTEQQSRIEKHIYQKVLEGYRKEMEQSSASQQLRYTTMKKRLAQRQKKIESQFEKEIEKQEEIRIELKATLDQAARPEIQNNFNTKAQAIEAELQKEFTELSEQLQIEFLQQQLRRKKIMDQLLKQSYF